MSNSSNAGGGIGLFGAMFLLFLGLKLGNVIDWSWWWVCAPIWGPLALFLGIVGIVAAVYSIAWLVTKIACGKPRKNGSGFSRW